MNALSVVIGFIGLISGSQLYWVFVGGTAFFIGGYLGGEYHLVNRELDLIIFSFVLSGIAVMLALYFRRLMVSLAGFFIGVYILTTLPAELGWSTRWITWHVSLLAGMISLVAVYSWYTWASIFLSTVGGAVAVIQKLNFGGISDLGIFIILFLIGLTAQILLWQYGKPETA